MRDEIDNLNDRYFTSQDAADAQEFYDYGVEWQLAYDKTRAIISPFIKPGYHDGHWWCAQSEKETLDEGWAETPHAAFDAALEVMRDFADAVANEKLGVK